MRILFIEDCKEIIDMANITFGKFLKEFKYLSIDHVSTIKDLKDLLLTKKQYDLIILDNNLPDGEAFDLLDLLNEKYQCDVFLNSSDYNKSQSVNKDNLYKIMYPKINNLEEVLCSYL